MQRTRDACPESEGPLDGRSEPGVRRGGHNGRSVGTCGDQQEGTQGSGKHSEAKGQADRRDAHPRPRSHPSSAPVHMPEEGGWQAFLSLVPTLGRGRARRAGDGRFRNYPCALSSPVPPRRRANLPGRLSEDRMGQAYPGVPRELERVSLCGHEKQQREEGQLKNWAANHRRGAVIPP